MFSHPYSYSCAGLPAETPCVYVCRHLNMHGPYVTLKWLPMEVHPFVLGVFLDEKTAREHYARYTFSLRRGKPEKSFLLRAQLLGWLTPKLLRSLQAIPVHRDAQAIKTLRIALRYLLEGHSLIIWPDVHYTDGYDQPCEIYEGFLYLGEWYQRKTGRELPFVPLIVDDENRRIEARDAVIIQNFQKQKEDVVLLLQDRLNP